MSLTEVVDRGTVAKLFLISAGLASVLIARMIRSLYTKRRHQHHGPSSRSRELTRGGLRPHILEHIVRMSDPDYVCLSIAENKLTVGPLVDKLLELAARPRESAQQQGLEKTTAIDYHDHHGEAEGIISSGGNDHPSSTAASASSLMCKPSGSCVGNPEQTVAVTRAAGPSAVPASMGYGDPTGPPWVRSEMAKMMSERMFLRKIDPDNLCFGAGTDAILRVLMVALTEDGQGCLIPHLYYAGFDEALTSAGLKAWAVKMHGKGMEAGIDAGISPTLLEAALRDAQSAGVDTRLLLLTSPHNPTGQLYSAKALITAITWARRRNLHVVMDEVYANCVHSSSAQFRSAASLAVDGCGMGNDVHIVYGLSKDFGVPGWRIGVLYTENKEVLATVSHMVRLSSQASSYTMDTVGKLFKETGFLDEFFQQHQEGLRKAYMSLVNELGRAGIKYIHAEAGLFVMLDLREFLQGSSKEAEANLWRQIVDGVGVNLTPGDALRCTEPGWFRLCFAYQEVDVVSRSVRRLSSFLQALKDNNAS